MSAALPDEATTQQPARIRTRSGPVVVLSYALAGSGLLTRTLSASSSLACTSGTGVLPLCHTAMVAWQQIENRSGPPSALAIKSVRALMDTMITVIRATTGAQRWCETAFAQPSSVDAFLQVIPTAAVLCLYRSLTGVLKDAAQSYPWGLGGSPFWPYSAGHPGNNVATVGAYWAASARSLLDCEAKHPDSCLRVRYEDLVTDPGTEARRIFEWFDVDQQDLALPRGPGRTAHGPDRPATAASAQASGPRSRQPDQTVPVDRIPSQLLDQVNRLHRELGYQELT